MGLIQKKDEKDEIDGIQIIERGEGPDGDEDEKIDLVAGTSAEHHCRRHDGRGGGRPTGGSDCRGCR